MEDEIVVHDNSENRIVPEVPVMMDDADLHRQE
jgi:hypothetical protein